MARLSLVALSCACALVLLFGAAAHAASPARQALESATDHILDDIKDPAYANPATRGPVRAKIEAEVLKIFDFEEFSSRTVGAPWRGFSAQQKKDFSAAFADLLITTYVNKIDGYNGEQVAYGDEISNKKGDRVEVRTVVTMKDGKKIPVAYRMLPKNNTWRVYDVLIENVSLVKNYRTQFQDILNNAQPDELIARVRLKAQEARK